MEKQLLHTPEGVRDIYNGECEEKLLIQNRIHNVLQLYGYNDIQTPSFEFFDIFNKERGTVSSNNMFKFFDREGNTLVLRPDITPGIARCAAKYFENEKGPVRLCYVGNTFINNSRYQGRLKETTQAGCELIGDYSIEADAEMIAMLVDSLLSTGLKEFQVEIGHIGFFKGLVKEAGINDELADELRDVIRNKNMFLIEDLLKNAGVDKEISDSIYKLPGMFGGVDILEKAKQITKDSLALHAIRHLENVYELLKLYGIEKYVTFDLGMLSELDYYTGVIFKAYTYDVGEPVANGGRYDKLIGQFGTEKASIGFCITIDLLHQAIKRQNVEVPSKDRGKLIKYDAQNSENAIKLAKYFRNSGICATITTITRPDDYEKYSDVIFADKTVLERYGIE